MNFDFIAIPTKTFPKQKIFCTGNLSRLMPARPTRPQACGGQLLRNCMNYARLRLSSGNGYSMCIAVARATVSL
jgi:hypothetical protein